MESEQMLSVEVRFITPDQQFHRALRVPEGTTIGEAICLSKIAEQFPAIDFGALKVGIYSRIKPPGTFLKDGDRLEIYRPLEVDPMAARRRRAKK